ncbi:hypothetical protein [Gordonia humi]|uniref:Sporulation protein YlmC with PRC-barrel domain n=1 Tax=Gordonia humi TaxID=686429 RepID=A0A840F2S5_9ACTN|nr:hypothetical protein [Gordonia humi]MBB4136246.1 sporulation protein YlmC with PRC-barrel domain [Gordonia humi]
MRARASELLGCEVVEDDRRVGVIVDLRLAVTDCGLDLVGLLVGPRKPIRLLGPYEADRSGPWLVDTLLRRRDRSIVCVAWTDVIEVGRDLVRIQRNRASRVPE